HRGGKGVMTMKVTDKTGGIVAIENVTDDNDLMIINRSGVTIRMHIADLRIMGRNTQGVKLINLRGKDVIASITKVDAEPDEEAAEVNTPNNAENAENVDNTNENTVGESVEPTEPEGETPTDKQEE
ncbi:MAG: DNA gyrase subunit A, partial [Bacteroidales bacterium]|nr:DNA gyrase subunit A [Bacteroidales bacterium]